MGGCPRSVHLSWHQEAQTKKCLGKHNTLMATTTWHIHWLSHDLSLEYHMSYLLSITWLIPWVSHELSLEYHMSYPLSITWVIPWVSHDLSLEYHMTYLLDCLSLTYLLLHDYHMTITWLAMLFHNCRAANAWPLSFRWLQSGPK